MSSGTQKLVPFPGPWKGIAPVIIILVFLFLAAPASAHPPSDMVLSYESGDLTATITHGVADPASHYVYRVTILVNSSPLDTILYESQPQESPFSYLYQVPADPGGVIEVTADCNIGGSITRTVLIGEIPGPDAPTLVLWPYHALFQVLGFILIIAAVLMMQFGKKMPGWYRWHKRLAHTGAVLIIIALGIGVAMVELSGGPHIRVPHALLGITTIALLVFTILLGYAKEKVRPPKLYLRTVHIAVGLVTILFLIITIILGLMTAGLV